MYAVKTGSIRFPEFSGVRCLMMPYIQGDPDSVPETYAPYKEIIESVYLKKGDVGFLTIDESPVIAGTSHRGHLAKHGRALHTEVGWRKENGFLQWAWGQGPEVKVDHDVQVLLANNLNNSCALWNAEHPDTSFDGDIGHLAELYPYSDAIFMRAGEVYRIGVLTPHESMPVMHNFNRQFLRIVSSGVHGREEYFTLNPLFSVN